MASWRAACSSPEELLKFRVSSSTSVSVVSGDITAMQADAVVIGEDAGLTGIGAVASAIARAGGPQYSRARDDMKRKQVPFSPFGFKHKQSVYWCDAGPHLPYKRVYHAILPMLYGIHAKQQWQTTMTQLYTSVCAEADTRNRETSIVVPILGSGGGGGDLEDSVWAALEGIKAYQSVYHLQDVILVEWDSTRAKKIVDICNRWMDRQTRVHKNLHIKVLPPSSAGGGAWGMASPGTRAPRQQAGLHPATSGLSGCGLDSSSPQRSSHRQPGSRPHAETGPGGGRAAASWGPPGSGSRGGEGFPRASSSSSQFGKETSPSTSRGWSGTGEKSKEGGTWGNPNYHKRDVLIRREEKEGKPEGGRSDVKVKKQLQRTNLKFEGEGRRVGSASGKVNIRETGVRQSTRSAATPKCLFSSLPDKTMAAAPSQPWNEKKRNFKRDLKQSIDPFDSKESTTSMPIDDRNLEGEGSQDASPEIDNLIADFAGVIHHDRHGGGGDGTDRASCASSEIDQSQGRKAPKFRVGTTPGPGHPGPLPQGLQFPQGWSGNNPAIPPHYPYGLPAPSFNMAVSHPRNAGHPYTELPLVQMNETQPPPSGPWDPTPPPGPHHQQILAPIVLGSSWRNASAGDDYLPREAPHGFQQRPHWGHRGGSQSSPPGQAPRGPGTPEEGPAGSRGAAPVRGAPSPGERGSQGAPSPGERGSQGAPSPGERGSQGAPSSGERGSQGAPSPGERGSQGAPSPGERGSQGAGFPGERGSQGTPSPGERGSQGAPSPGERGSQGATSPGERGSQGAGSQARASTQQQAGNHPGGNGGKEGKLYPDLTPFKSELFVQLSAGGSVVGQETSPASGPQMRGGHKGDNSMPGAGSSQGYLPYTASHGEGGKDGGRSPITTSQEPPAQVMDHGIGNSSVEAERAGAKTDFGDEYLDDWRVSNSYPGNFSSLALSQLPGNNSPSAGIMQAGNAQHQSRQKRSRTSETSGTPGRAFQESSCPRPQQQTPEERQDERAQHTGRDSYRKSGTRRTNRAFSREETAGDPNHEEPATSGYHGPNEQGGEGTFSKDKQNPPPRSSDHSQQAGSSEDDHNREADGNEQEPREEEQDTEGVPEGDRRGAAEPEGRRRQKEEEEDDYNGEEEPKAREAPVTGSMPEGKMATSVKEKIQLGGFEPDCGTILIEYSFTNGIQQEGHPAPGQPYKGTFRRAFLPDNQEGRRVLDLLKEAFHRKLTFELVRSGPEQEWGVEFADIPHKTSLRGGVEGNGFPDPDYLPLVSATLQSLGVGDA